MDDRYRLDAPEQIPSPAFLVYDHWVDRNINAMIQVAGDPDRLRPHCKTHKTPQIVKKLLAKGIQKHKCATIAEAEMLALAGARDIFLAYNIVGPNVDRVVRFRESFPETKLIVTADHPDPLSRLSQAFDRAGLEIDVAVDVETGLQRTGIAPIGPALELYEMLSCLPGIQAGGLHWYDGQNRQTDLLERRTAVETGFQKLLKLRDSLLMNGFKVPRIVAGGTGSFPIYAQMSEPNLELSPGTVILHDAGYGSIYPDLEFVPAAIVLTRVISRPSVNRLTLDAGTKAMAADPPMETRCRFPELPDARIVLQNEEHLVIETKDAESYGPGDVLVAIPWHVCPTTALYDSLRIIRDGEEIDQWAVTARNRRLSI